MWRLMNPMGMFGWVRQDNPQLVATRINLLVIRIIGIGVLLFAIYIFSFM
jgi:hypothetical protein